MAAGRRVTVLAGGYGGAKLSHGLALASAGRGLDGAGHRPSVVANTGDDLELHGLSVSPDLDTVMYTLAGLANEETGWGVRDETWSTPGCSRDWVRPTWFRLGDRDLATHLWRTARLREGQRLTEVTARLATALDVAARLLPMTDAAVRTELLTADGWLEFQDYFVHRHHADAVTALRYRGADGRTTHRRGAGRHRGADLIVVAPSNPFVSIGTILAVPGIADALLAAPAPVVAVSPIVGGAALRGPADRMLETLGGEASALGVARHYQDRTRAWSMPSSSTVMRRGRRRCHRGPGTRAAGTGTVMRDHDDREHLAEGILGPLAA